MVRCGNTTNIYTDNGTNFVGANRELKELRQKYRQEDHKCRIANAFSEDKIEWHYIQPNTPHFGGLWEDAVKAFKKHIRRVAGNVIPSFKEVYTLMVQIEAILNSRPLTALSNDPNDLSCLTPGHFRVGDSLTAVPEPSLLDTSSNRLYRWQLVEKLRQHFWSRWHTEYLGQLQQRTK